MNYPKKILIVSFVTFCAAFVFPIFLTAILDSIWEYAHSFQVSYERMDIVKTLYSISIIIVMVFGLVGSYPLKNKFVSVSEYRYYAFSNMMVAFFGILFGFVSCIILFSGFIYKITYF